MGGDGFTSFTCVLAWQRREGGGGEGVQWVSDGAVLTRLFGGRGERQAQVGVVFRVQPPLVLLSAPSHAVQTNPWIRNDRRNMRWRVCFFSFSRLDFKGYQIHENLLKTAIKVQRYTKEILHLLDYLGLGNILIWYQYCDMRLDTVLDFGYHYILIWPKCFLFLFL